MAAATSAVRNQVGRLFGWIPNWVGFVLIMAVGVVLLAFGAAKMDAGFIAWGIAAIAAAVLAWLDGARSKPKVSLSPKTFGGVVANVDDWAWLIIFGMFVAALLIGIFTRRG